MKKIFIPFCALVLAIASCSLYSGGNVSVNGGKILARIITGENTQLKMVFQLSGGMNEYIEETGTLSELKQKIFSFDQIPAGTKINVVCTIIYDDGTAEGQEVCRAQGNDIVIKEGHNDIKLKMEKTLGGPGFSVNLPNSQNEIEVTLDEPNKTLVATDGYTTYKWIVNGTEQTSTTKTLDIKDFPNGVYQIVVIADDIYSARFELVWEQ